MQVVARTDLPDLAGLGTEAVTADRQLSSVRQGCVGKMGAMRQENFALKLPKIMIFGGEERHSELHKSELENGYCNCEHNGHIGTKAAFLV